MPQLHDTGYKFLFSHADLVRGKQINLADGLPPVLPMVIYNGDARWQQSPELFDLIQPHPAALAAFQPHLKFWLLDEGSFSASYLVGLQRVMAAIFRMEHTQDTEEAKQAIRYLGQSRCRRFLFSSLRAQRGSPCWQGRLYWVYTN